MDGDDFKAPWHQISGTGSISREGAMLGGFASLKLTGFNHYTLTSAVPSGGDIDDRVVKSMRTDNWWYGCSWLASPPQDNAQWVNWIVGAVGSGNIMYGIGYVAISSSQFNVRLWKADFADLNNVVYTLLATGSTSLGNTSVHRMAIRVGPSGSNYPIEVWVNGTREINYGGSAAIAQLDPYISLYNQEVLQGDKAGDGAARYDNHIWRDENAGDTENSSTAPLPSSYFVVGHQFSADVTDSAINMTTNPSGKKAHQVSDDFNDFASEGASDHFTISSGEIGLQVEALGNASPTIRFVTLYANAPSAADKSLKVCIDDGTAETFTKKWSSHLTNRVGIPMNEAPGSQIWDDDLFDSMQITLLGSLSCEQIVAEVCGTGLSSLPTETPDGGGSDVTGICPTVAAAARRRLAQVI